MARSWGGQLVPREDGSYHATLWRAGDSPKDKGERLSWEQHEDGRVEDCHHTDQNRRSHSSDPRSWRAGWLLILMTLTAVALHILLSC